MMTNISGDWIDGQFFSHERIRLAPKVWRFASASPTFYLRYITELEYDFLKQRYSEYKEFPGPKDIVYLFNKTDSFVALDNDVTHHAPRYYRSDKNYPIHFLCYLTQDQIDLVIEADIHKANLKNKNYFGPENIPRYDNGGGDGGGFGGGDGAFGGDASGYVDSSAGFGPVYGIQYRNAFSSNGTISIPSGINSNAAPVYTTAISNVYDGSLTSQGNMLAMQLTPAEYNTVANVITGQTEYEPWLWGYFRLYWEDPRKTTFGANSAIPALTGVVPTKYSDQIPGNLLYWIDLALVRLTGTFDKQPAFWNIYYFMNIFNQSLGWVTSTNDYINSLNQAEQTNLQYYGSNNYSDYVTKGLDVFTKGNALLQAFTNIGTLVQTIPSGYFGTANSVAKIMLDSGLGFINDLTVKLRLANVDLNDIYNPNYTRAIETVLATITNKSDLITIQGVLESSIPNIQSPLDFTDISKASGLPNDSNFKTMAAAGVKLYELCSGLTFTTGASLATLLKSLSTDGAEELTGINSGTGVLTPEIIKSLRSFLPQTADNQPISIINVIGSAAGYYTEQLKKVNDAIEAIYATTYGPQIRSLMESISQYNSLNQIEEETNAKKQYYDLLERMSKDPNENIAYLVDVINTNYDFICQQLYFEISNYNKANFTISTAADDQMLFNFVTAMPYYAADPSNINTDALLYGLAQPNQPGNLVKAILSQAKNNQLLGQSGIGITNI